MEVLLPSIVGAVVPDSPIRGTLVLTSRRPRVFLVSPLHLLSMPHAMHSHSLFLPHGSHYIFTRRRSTQ